MKAGIATALEHAEQLHAVLEEEFQALTIDDIDGFEKLQPAKNELLAQLTGYVQTVSQQPPAPPAAGEDDKGWELFRSRMQACREIHLRNEILIRSRLEAIRGTLRILQNSSETDGAVELYDRLGRVSENYGHKRYTDA